MVSQIKDTLIKAMRAEAEQMHAAIQYMRDAVNPSQTKSADDLAGLPLQKVLADFDLSRAQLNVDRDVPMRALLNLNKYYRGVQIAPAALRKAVQVYRDGLPKIDGTIETLTISAGDLRRPCDLADLDRVLSERKVGVTHQWSRSDYVKGVGDYRLFLAWTDHSLSLDASSESEAHLRGIARVFEQTGSGFSDTGDTSETRRLVIFIGHGRSPAWRQLKDHLHDQNHYSMEHYERVPTSGFLVWNRISMMLQNSTIALLVLTGEDSIGDRSESMRARQNVIHELGLSQGRFGINRALPLIETGVEIPSHLLGIDYIPFSRGNIRETFGAVLASIRREFPEAY